MKMERVSRHQGENTNSEREDESILGHDTQIECVDAVRTGSVCATGRGNGDKDYKLCGGLKLP